MLGLFQDRKSLVSKYRVEALVMISDYGDGAEDRARSRAAQCARGTRDYKHWDALAKTIAYINEQGLVT